jgi:hypothetical protein
MAAQTPMNPPRDPQQQGKSNLRLALALASVALVFFVGFVAKIVLFGR